MSTLKERMQSGGLGQIYKPYRALIIQTDILPKDLTLDTWLKMSSQLGVMIMDSPPEPYVMLPSILGGWINPDYRDLFGGTKKNPLKLKRTNKWKP